MSDTITYRKLNKDPTKSHQTKFIKLLKEIKQSGNLSEAKYNKLYPTSCCVPQFYGLPKVHKTGATLRPIVSGINLVHHETGKYLAEILSAVVGKPEHHLKNTEDFVKRIKDIRVEPDEVLLSYDVSSLFTYIPVNSAIEVVADLLKHDPNWKNKTGLSADRVVKLLDLYLNSSYFVARDQFYQQCEGCTMAARPGLSLLICLWSILRE